MTESTKSARDALRGAVIYGALWLASLIWLSMHYSSYRANNAIELLGQIHEGTDAVLIMGLLIIVPVILFALAIRNLQQYIDRRE